MILEQHYLGCLAQASYFLADERTKTAVVIDPRRDVGIYLDRAKELGVTIRHVMLTHFHADFLAGHLELRAACDAKVWLGERAEAEFDFEEMVDGESMELGDVTLRFLSTPGHTPESTSILVFDTTKSTEEPHAVMTGDTLFIGDVGRPDLMSSVGLTSEELAGWMYDSLHGKLLTLPDQTIVYPGHGAGSMCGKNLSSDTWSTIGQQRESNYALQPMERAEFVAMLTANQPQAPAYFPYDAELNKKEHPSIAGVLQAGRKGLSLDEVVREQNAGAVVLDVRDAEAFAAGHLAGSVHVGLDGMYATWVGTLVPSDRRIVLLTDPGAEEEAARRLGRIGFDRVAGTLEGGIEAVPAGDRATHARIEPEELRRRLDGPTPPLVVDVRGPGEWDAGHIDGAQHVPLQRFPSELETIPTDRDLVLVCKSGYRSSTAASLLLGRARSVTDLRGGMDAFTGQEACV